MTLFGVQPRPLRLRGGVDVVTVAARPPVRARVLVAGGAGATPLKSTPAIITKADLTDYVAMLVPLMKGLNADSLAHVVYLDPAEEHAEVEELLGKAAALDGCDQGLTCAGWRDDEPAPSVVTQPKAWKAREYRREAFQHRTDARLMEDRIASREAASGPMTNAHIASEVTFWREWVDFRKRLEKYIDSLNGASVFKPSDFEQLQQFDLQLQQFRTRYVELTGLQPSTPLPPAVPHDPANQVPWNGILLVGGLIGGGLLVGSLAKLVRG